MKRVVCILTVLIIATVSLFGGCTSNKTVTVTDAETTVTSWLTTITDTVIETQPAVTLTAAPTTIVTTNTTTETSTITETSIITLPVETTTITVEIEPTPTTTPPTTSTIPATLNNSIVTYVSNYVTIGNYGVLKLKSGDTSANIYIDVILDNVSNVTFNNVKFKIGFIIDGIDFSTPIVKNIFNAGDTSNWIYDNNGTINILSRIPNITINSGENEYLYCITLNFDALTADVELPYALFANIS